MKKLPIILAALTVTALLAAPLLFPAVRAGAAIERILESGLGRDVTIGQARFTGFTSVRVSDVAVSSSSGTSFSAKRLTVTTGFVPLLKGRVDTGRFSADGVVATWHGLEAVGELSGSFDAGQKRFRIDRFDLSSGVSRFTGAVERGRLDVGWTDLDLSSTAVVALPEGLSISGLTSGQARIEISSSGHRTSVSMDLGAAAIDWKTVASKAAGTPMTVAASLDRLGDVLTIRDLDVSLASIRISGDGEVAGEGESTRIASLRLKTGSFDIADLFRHLNMVVSEEIVLQGPASATLSVDGGTRGGRFVADIDGTRLEIGYRNTFWKKADVPLRVLTEGRYATPLAIDLPSMRIETNGMELTGSGSYTPGKLRPTYTFRLKSNVFPMASAAALLPAIEPFQAEGQGVANVRIIRGEKGPAMSGTLTLIGAGARFGGSVISAVSGSVPFTDDAFSARALTGKLDGSSLRADVSAHRYAERVFLEADLRVDEFDFDHFLSGPIVLSSAPFDTAGALRAGHIQHASLSADDATFEWNLAGVSGSSMPVAGTVSWRQGPGRLSDLGPLVDGSTVARALLLPLSVLQKGGFDLSRLDFEAIDADVSLSSGIATMNGFLLQGEARDVGLKGSFPITDEGPLSLSARLRSPGRSDATRVTIEGTPSSPSFSQP